MTYFFLLKVNCLWSEWNEWSDCTSSCGGGERTSRRIKLQLAQNKGIECEGNDVKTEQCNSDPCPGF